MKKYFLFAALAFSLSGFAQKVNGKISLKKGQKFEVVTETKSSATQEVMGQTMETTSQTVLTEVYDVEAADANNATVEHKTKRFTMSGEAMGRSQSYDSENPADAQSEIGQLLDKKLLKNKYSMTVDAYGKIVSVKLDDSNPAGKEQEEEGGMAEMMTQQLGIASGSPKPGDASVFSIIPANREVAGGDTWSDSTNKEGIKNVKMYTVKSVTQNAVLIDYTSQVKIEKTMEVMGTEATINTTNSSTGTITVDRTTGLVQTVTSITKTAGTIEAQGMTIPMTGETSVKMTVSAK